MDCPICCCLNDWNGEISERLFADPAAPMSGDMAWHDCICTVSWLEHWLSGVGTKQPDTRSESRECEVLEWKTLTGALGGSGVG